VARIGNTTRKQTGHVAQGRILVVTGAILSVAAAHFLVSDLGHGLHVVHIALAGAFLLPIIACAIWFQVRHVIAITLLISAIYVVYMQVRWPNQPMENANQWAFIVGYWIVALLTTSLVQRMRAEQAQRRLAERRSILEALDSLAAALEARDAYTRKHSEHVADLAAQIALAHGMSPEKIEVIRLAGLVHDLGKVGVRDDVLLKPGTLTQQERESIERHPAVAAEILAKIPAAGEIANIVLAHHECPDGSGYPRHLSRAAIPTEASILRVADVFCSLTEDRPYKHGMETAGALALMRELAGRKIDERSFNSLLQLVPTLPESRL
jgi:putative nucleotidyltransferase with HDIG domain